MSSNTEVIKGRGKSSSVDDPWAPCDSTSHPGHKFYVNQRTGIKVWNITESEILFAEKADKKGPEPQKCPTMNHSKIEKICNKQIINNQFSNQLSNLMVNTVPVCSFNVWDNPLNQPQQSYTLVPTAVAEAYQRLLPTLPNTLQNASLPMSFNTNPNPVLNATLPVAYNRHPNTSQKTNLPMAFNTNPPIQNHPMSRFTSQGGKQRYSNWRRNNEFGHKNDKQKTYVDLRQKLVRRKSFNETYIGNNVKNEANIKNENTRNEANWENTTVQISLEPLKLLTSSGSDGDQWYIVVDTDVILKNYNYMNNMASADPDCHLVVPHHVMSELKLHVSKSSNVQARRILRFLTQQIESGLAVLGGKVTGESASHMIIMTCANLASQNTQVVLITSDTEIVNYKTISKNVHVFTMQEVKDILANRPVKISRANSPTLAIKIIVPNNADESNRAKQEVFEPPLITFDATERANDTGDIPGTSPRIIDDSTQFTNDTRDICKTTFGKNTDSTSDAPETRSQRTIDSTEFANDTRDIPRTPSRSNIDSNECTNDTRDNSGSETLYKRTLGLTEHANADRDIFDTSFKRTTKSTKIANDARGKTEINSRGKLDSRKLTNNAPDISESTCQRIIDSNECPNNTRDTSETTTRRIVDSTELDNEQTTRSTDSWNQNLAKPAIPAKVNTNKTLETQSVEKSEAACCRSPSKSVPETVKHLSDTAGTIEGQRGVKHFEPSPAKSSDLSSARSSTTSGCISLDTIRMKRIISMKRLTNASFKVRHQPASITSNKSQTSTKSLGFMPQAIYAMPYRPSISRSTSYDNDNNSEASVVKRKKVVPENVTVEETSTSGVISDSSHSEKARNSIQNDVKKVTRRSIFMYKVACPSMEDVLKTRFDEWLLRFVQIMEEVLRVKLQEKLPFDDKEYPAPRDLQEATACIINKYIKNFNIVNAANNLSFILYRAGDENGKIADNIQPSDYMEMYSYGVFLVETFQDMNAECKEKDCKKDKIKSKEDKADSCSCYEVNAASESLKKLLYDIHNANQDTFVDHPHHLSMDNPNSDPCDFDIDTREDSMQDSEDLENPYYDEQESAIMQVLPEAMKSPYYDETPCDRSNSFHSYNLRSQKRKSQSTEGDVSQKETIIEKGIESNFFDSLHLQKTVHVNNDVNDLNNTEKENSLKNETSVNVAERNQTADEREKEPVLHNLKIHFSKNDSKNPTFQSKVVCNFTVNPDIERKVKARLNQKEYEDENYDDEDTEKQNRIIDEKRTEDDRKSCEYSNEVKSEANDNFTCYIALITHSFLEIFGHVKSLCDEYINANKESDVCTVNELHQMLQKEYTNISNIHHALDSIINREEFNMDENIQILLKMANLDDIIIPNDELCLQYRTLITKCKKTTEDYLVIIRRILKLDRG